MSLYRCAACGSPRVVESSEQSGYSYSKGLLCTLILGGGGAAAGINGKTKKVYKCPDCGLTLDKPMSNDLQFAIDVAAVRSDPEKRIVEFQGHQLSWDTLARTYKNIGIGTKSSDSYGLTSSEKEEIERAKRAREAADARRQANEQLKKEILSIFQSEPDRAFTVCEVIELVGEECSIPKMACLLKYLTDDGYISRVCNESRKILYQAVPFEV